MTYNEQNWRYAAATLGLGLYEPVGPYRSDACFEHLERARGTRVAQATKGAFWMSGRFHVAPLQRDIEILLLANAVTTQHSGADPHQPGSTEVSTHVIARIDPPLLLGLQLDSPRTMDPLLGPKLTIDSGDPQLDRTFALKAVMPGAATRLLGRVTAAPNDLLDHLYASRTLGPVSISDTCVNLKTSYTDDVAVLAPRIAAAASLAAFLGSRRGPLPRDADEHARLTAWRAVAESARLGFDDARFVISGAMHGVRVRLAVETELATSYTSLVVEPPRPLGLGLRLSKQGALQFLVGLFGSQDVRVGDSVFDGAFVIKAKDEAGVRSLFASNAAARGALVDLLQLSPELVLDDERLVMRWPSIANEPTLQSVLQSVKALATALAPSHAPAPAYR